MDEGRSQSDYFRRLEAAFHEAQALPEGERSAWLARQFDGDPGLRDRLERMLASAGSETPTRGVRDEIARLAGLEAPRSRAEPGRLVGMRLGAYRLIEFRGEGGFGEVYLAEQLEPIRRRVAIKVLRDDRAWGESLDRFKGEVESLARLEHPGIARIYDAGEAVPLREEADVTGDSAEAAGVAADEATVLFIAMEFVDGVPITVDASRRQASAVERLRVVAAAADAMQHAHQRGIIHRDIKPSNVLVTEVNGVASPKIIDFGIAKVIDAGHVQARVQPVEGRAVTGVVGTPQYMSPEQSDRRRTRDVDTRTDIYSMGVILRELMTGVRSDTHGSGHSLGRPSPTPQPHARSAPIAVRASRPMREDLERIIRKATHPDRDARYASAGAFAEDLERVEAGEPVSAGPATLRYRLSRLLWRNRLVTAAIVVACLAMLGGSVAALVGLLKAREQAARADAVNGFLEDVLTSVNPDRRGADVPLSTVMSEASSSVAARFAGQPLVEADTRSLIAATFANLWRMELADREYAIALELYTAALGPDDERTVKTRVRQLQVMAALGKVKEVDAQGAELLAQVRRVLGPRTREAAMVELMGARVAVARGRIDEGAKAISDAGEWITRDLGDDAELIGWLMADQIRVLRRIAFNEGFVTERAKARLKEAYDLSLRLVDHQRARTPPNLLATLVAEIEHSRAALDTGRFQESLDVSAKVLGESDGTLSDCHDARLEAMELQAYSHRAMGEGERALQAYSRVIACRRELESSPASSLMLVAREFDLIPFLDYARHFDESEAQSRRVIELLKPFGDMGASVRFSAETYLARALSQQGRKEEATTLFTDLAARVKRNQPFDSVGRLYAFMAAHLASVGRGEEARMSIGASYAALPPETSGTWQYHVDDRLVVLIEACEALGESAEAAGHKAVREKLLERNRKSTDVHEDPR
jgi:serine/threonine protein kinase